MFNRFFISGLAIIFVLLSLMLAGSSCSSKEGKSTEPETEDVDEVSAQKQKEVELYDEVISIHDELMPKIQEIADLRMRVSEKLDSVDREQDPELVENLSTVILELDSAEEGMMNWMRNFKSTNDTLEHQLVMNYLDGEKKKIAEVREIMLNAIQTASNTFGGNNE